MTETPEIGDSELTWELLGAYEACESLGNHYNEWCAMVGLDPALDESEPAYHLIHNAYMDVWRQMDSAAFFDRLNVHRDRWIARRRGSELTGKPVLVAHA